MNILNIQSDMAKTQKALFIYFALDSTINVRYNSITLYKITQSTSIHETTQQYTINCFGTCKFNISLYFE